MAVQQEVVNVYRKLNPYLPMPSKDEPNAVCPTILLFVVQKFIILRQHGLGCRGGGGRVGGV